MGRDINMKRTIPFEIFEENQTIYFDIIRLAELEKAVGMSIAEIVKKQESGINFCLCGLLVGLKHHYHKATLAFYAEKIDEYLDKGGQLDDIAIPIIRAIVASGIFGKEISDKTEEMVKETEKNV